MLFIWSLCASVYNFTRQINYKPKIPNLKIWRVLSEFSITAQDASVAASASLVCLYSTACRRASLVYRCFCSPYKQQIDIFELVPKSYCYCDITVHSLPIPVVLLRVSYPLSSEYHMSACLGGSVDQATGLQCSLLMWLSGCGGLEFKPWAYWLVG